VSTGSSGVLDVISLLNTPAGRVAPQSNVRFVATDDHFTLTIDDAATLTGGTLEVWIANWDDGYYDQPGWVCLPDNQPVEFKAVRGATYYVSLHDHIFPSCGRGATAGTITLLA
jgi:hypothetical protein